ncbi:MAG: cytochrome-c oxidase, cbb3-type subunit II [Thiohalocapsa sp.]|jgi:cytochrome c oxidase cbb3-type subunit 2|uniref:cytochrome-c oxidase, cbb3-type subunit II n=1 Tax=Thiohalocapsa sp. TaxID=2497641 RepID=UPI0025E0C0FA|nr:cytochrome-c oxidase, cbb3-type subunit II [Thiohalocapsa sp.]MCG6942186.1 cytochrome-c oxidase, cbb3-type subunit II [Thiohalocapsa sp.]
MSDSNNASNGLQAWLERNIWGLVIALAIVLSVGGIVEIVPLFYLKGTEEATRFPQIVWDKAGKEPIVAVTYEHDAKGKIKRDEAGDPVVVEMKENWVAGDGVRPYTALELAGRDVYQREGCYLCHSQMVRPFRDERERYGHYSLASESMFDHPFQWGSKRTGPDLARVGGKYSDQWQRQHLTNPRSVVPESVMPSYPWLAKREISAKRMQRHMRGLRAIGVPYSDADIEAADGLLAGKTEMDATIAYLQVLGTMAKLEPGVDYRQ